MVGSERGPKGRYRMCQPGLVQRDCIEIAFDDNDRLRPTDGLAGDIKGKKRLPLLEQRRIRRYAYGGR